MKKIFNSLPLLILAIIGFSLIAVSNLSAQSGWRDSSYFKIQKEKVENLKYFKVSADGQFYFTLSDTNKLTKWNIETGQKEYIKILNIPTGYQGFSISNLDEHYGYGVFHPTDNLGYFSVYIHNLTDTNIINTFNTNQGFKISSTLNSAALTILVDDTIDSIYTAVNLKDAISWMVNDNGFFEIHSLDSTNIDDNKKYESINIVNFIHNPTFPKIILNVSDINKKNDPYSDQYTEYKSINIFDKKTSRSQRYYFSRCNSNYEYGENGSSSSDGECTHFNSFAINSDNSKMYFSLRTDSCSLGIIDLNSDSNIVRIDPKITFDTLLFVKNDYLLTTKNDYGNYTTINVYNPTDWHCFDKLQINDAEMGTLYPIPNSDKLLIRSTNGYYRILDFASAFMSKDSYISVSDTLQTIQDTFRFSTLFKSKPDSVLWNFDDGTTSKDWNPSHSFAQKGIYSVTLTEFRNQTQKLLDTTLKITIIEKPISNFECDSRRGVAPLSFTINNTSTGSIDSCMWWFEDKVMGTTKNLSLEIATPGTYSVRLKSFANKYTDEKEENFFIHVLNKQPASVQCISANEVHYYDYNNIDYSIVEISPEKYLINFSSPATIKDSNTFVQELATQFPEDVKLYPLCPGYYFSRYVIDDGGYYDTPYLRVHNDTNASFIKLFNRTQEAYFNSKGKYNDSNNIFMESNQFYTNLILFDKTNFQLNSYELPCYGFYISHNSLESTDNTLKLLSTHYDHKVYIHNISKEKQTIIDTILTNLSFDDGINTKLIINLSKDYLKYLHFDSIIQNISNYSIISIYDTIAISFNYPPQAITMYNNCLYFCGSKNNMPICSVIDTNGNSVCEVIWADRIGEFDKIQTTYDRNILLSGFSYSATDSTKTPRLFYTKIARDYFTQLSNVNIDKISANENKSALFPNPANGITNLQVNAEVGTELKISIYDMQGREIHKIFSGRSDSRQLNLMFDAKKYCPTAGAYFIQIERNGQIETVNMIVE